MISPENMGLPDASAAIDPKDARRRRAAAGPLSWAASFGTLSRPSPMQNI